MEVGLQKLAHGCLPPKELQRKKLHLLPSRLRTPFPFQPLCSYGRLAWWLSVGWMSPGLCWKHSQLLPALPILPPTKIAIINGIPASMWMDYIGLCINSYNVSMIISIMTMLPNGTRPPGYSKVCVPLSTGCVHNRSQVQSILTLLYRRSKGFVCTNFSCERGRRGGSHPSVRLGCSVALPFPFWCCRRHRLLPQVHSKQLQTLLLNC